MSLTTDALTKTRTLYHIYGYRKVTVVSGDRWLRGRLRWVLLATRATLDEARERAATSATITMNRKVRIVRVTETREEVS